MDNIHENYDEETGFGHTVVGVGLLNAHNLNIVLRDVRLADNDWWLEVVFVGIPDTTQSICMASTGGQIPFLDTFEGLDRRQVRGIRDQLVHVEATNTFNFDISVVYTGLASPYVQSVTFCGRDVRLPVVS